MTKCKKKLDIGQATIFDLLSEIQEQSVIVTSPGSMDIDSRFRAAISEALKACRLSRFGVAARMSELTGTEITKSMLDSWTAESKENHRFPAIYLPAFCEATGNHEPLRMLSSLVGVFILPGPEALRAEIRRIEEEIEKKQHERRKRLLFLREMEPQK